MIADRQVSGIRRCVRDATLLRRAVANEATDADVGDASFWAAVRQLPVRQAQVVVLHYLDDRSIADIAAVLGIAEGTVKAHVFAARRALARLLGDEIDEEDA